MSHQPSTAEPDPPRKAVLFCPECRHESPPDGDWIVGDDGEVATYRCPDCGATVTRRDERPLLAKH